MASDAEDVIARVQIKLLEIDRDRAVFVCSAVFLPVGDIAVAEIGRLAIVDVQTVDRRLRGALAHGNGRTIEHQIQSIVRVGLNRALSLVRLSAEMMETGGFITEEDVYKRQAVLSIVAETICASFALLPFRPNL